jgi:hypothetical protein
MKNESLLNLAKQYGDTITRMFMDRVELDYEKFWGTSNENPYESYVDMLETEFIAMGCDHWDFTRETIADFLHSIVDEETFTKLTDDWNDIMYDDFGSISDYYFDYYISDKIVDIVYKEKQNENKTI